MPKNKTNNFLKAIKKYAQEQQNAMKGEVAQLKTERLKETEARAKRDSKQLIKQKLSEKRSEQTALIASKIQEGQKKLFIERAAMTDEIFSLSAQKLTDYTKTDAYVEKLRTSAREIAQLFGGKGCVIYLSEKDADKADELKALFGGTAQAQTDKTIRIGGIKAYCENMGIIADETLDTKLEAQREWFCANAELNVL
ncbi:MAG: hypothetical protein K6F88_02790 [Ruminococcus sp.]|nr:hypothetical protein [Ruminococcus sp.]